MKASKIREMTGEELDRKERDISEELFRLRFQHVTGQLENPVRLRYLRRELARVKTIRRQKEGPASKTASTVKEKAD